MAWLSEAMIENAPMSWRMSSAAIVSLRMRLSAKATSSGIDGIEVMADHQHVEMLVDRVDRVGPASDWSRTGERSAAPQTLMMSGAWPPPAPSVWKAWMVRPLKAAIVFSTKPELVQRVGVDHHLHVDVVGNRKAAVDGSRASFPSPRAA